MTRTLLTPESNRGTLVTGAVGDIGRAPVQSLPARGRLVLLIDLPSYRPDAMAITLGDRAYATATDGTVETAPANSARTTLRNSCASTGSLQMQAFPVVAPVGRTAVQEHGPKGISVHDICPDAQAGNLLTDTPAYLTGTDVPIDGIHY